MEAKGIVDFQHIIGASGVILASLQLVLYYITSSIRRESDRQDKRLDGIETRLNNAWSEISGCKDKCELKRGSLIERMRKDFYSICKRCDE